MIAPWFRTAGALLSPSPSRQSEPAQRRRARRSGRGRPRVLRAALLAGALLAGLTPATAQAQDSVLISNRGQSDASSLGFGRVGGFGTNRIAVAQSFTTGSNAGGYTLSSVVWDASGNTSGVEIAIYSSSGINPGTQEFALTTSVSSGVATSNAPANSTLAADTTYFVVFNKASNPQARVGRTVLYAEDAGGESGWSIANHYRRGINSLSNWGDPGSTQVIEFEIRGTVTGAADTTAPALSATTPPRVNGATLTLTYDEALNTTAPAASAFSVSVDGGAGAEPSAVSITDTAVTLTLASAVTGGQTVTVSYTKPTDNPIQDTSGNEAAALTNQAVTNNTPGVKLTPATLTVAEDGSGTYTVALTALPTGEVTVAITSDNDDVDIDDTDAETDLIQNFLVFTTSDWDTAQTVTVNAVDDDDAVADTATLTHAISGASEYNSLSDPTLSVTVEEDDKLPGEPSIDSVTPGPGLLSVAWNAPVDPGYSDGTDGTHTDNTVDAYDVRHILTTATDKSDSQWTVEDNAWTTGNLVYVITSLTAGSSYDVQVRAVTEVGAGPWSSTSAATPQAPPTDTTAPALSSTTPPTVNGATLTLTYDETLNTGSVPAVGDYTVTVEDEDDPTVSGVSVSGSTVTLTLSPATAGGQEVMVSYTAGTNPVQDPAGNNAADLSDQAVTNALTPVVTISASATSIEEGAAVTVTFAAAPAPADELEVFYSITDGSAFGLNATERVVTIAASETSKAVVLQTTPDTVDDTDATFTVALATDVTEGGDGYVTGATTSVDVGVTQSDAPEVSIAAAPSTIVEGGTVTLTFTADATLAADLHVIYLIVGGDPFGVDSGHDELQTATIASGQTAKTVEIATQPDDFATNPAATLSFRIEPSASPAGPAYLLGATPRADVTVTQDTTAPTLSTATVSGTTLTLTYNEALDTGSVPATTAFAVSVDSGAGAAPSAVSISGSAVTLTLAAAVTAGQTVTLDYTVPTGMNANPIQDRAGNDAAALDNRAVTNSAVGIAYAGSFTEGAANDGSVTGSVTATLTGDTFTSDVVSGDHVTASNVPASLNASFVRTSDTVVTLTLTGNANAHANANDVSNLTVTFGNDAFTNETASTVGGSTKNDLAIDFRDASSIAYAGSFAEASDNDGSITGSVTATLTGDTFTSDVVSAPHVSAANVPEGLTASFARTSDTVVTLTLTGNAGAHADGDDVSDLTVTFADGAFTAETASTVGGSTKSDLAIDFAGAAMEPYVPRDFRAQPLNNGIRYRWEAPSAGGQTGYEIRYSTDASFPDGTMTLTPAANATTVVERGMTPGTEQFSQIRAKDADGNFGPWSYTLKTTPDTPANRMNPDAPAAPTVTAGDGSLTVTWTAPNDRGNTITDYHVRHIRTDATNKSDDDAWTSAGGAEWRIGRDTELTYTISGLENDVSYDVQVQATTGNGKGDWSPTTAGTPMGADTPMDTTAPALSTTAPPAVNGATLTLTYNEALDTGSVPAADAFEVTVAGSTRDLAGTRPVAVDGMAVTLTLSSAAAGGETVTLDYTPPTTNPIRDTAGNDAAALNDQAVANVTPGIKLSPESLTVDEEATGTYTVVLTAQPSASVTVTIASNNDDVTVDTDAVTQNDQDTLTFTTTTWNTAQTVTVAAADDPDATDDIVTLTHAITGASEYTSLAPTLEVRVDDNETPVATGIAYAGGFTEAAANDGSVTGSVTATLTGDTFTSDVVTGNHVTASNVPMGLTASFARTSNTVVTLTLTGNANAHANVNDVSNLTVTFGNGAFTNETAATVSGSTKSDLAIDFTDASTLTYAGSFTEAGANDGSVTGSVTATLAGDTFTGDVVSANRVTAGNVPAGLTASFARTSDTVVTLTLTGNADDHESSDDVSDLTVTFADAAFTNEGAATIAGATKNDLAISFTDASTLTYAGSFTEAAANDGSVTGSVTATLAGDTFTATVVSGNHVTASNLPAGLTASFARTSATVVTLTLTGNADDHENSDDVGDLTVTFADAAFTNEAASTIGGSTKNDLSVDFTDASTLTYAGSFTEAAANDGSVTGSVTATLAGDTFTSTVVSGNHVTASNVPAGLTASFARTSATVVTLTLTGNADDHENSDDVSDLTVTFADAAFTNEAAGTIGGSTKNDLSIDFTDASTLTYAGSFAEAAANDGSVTGSVTATLAGDTFTSAVVSGNHVTATNVPAGLTASFARTSDTVVTLTLTGNADDHEHSDDVSDLTVTFADAAFTNEAAATIAGATKNDLAIDFRDASSIAYAGGFTEAAANDGSVTGSVRATLTGDTFASDVVSGNHVTASNVPSGLTASFARTSGTVVTLTLTGNAGAHANANDVSDLTVTFADGAFTNEAASTVSGTTRNDLAIDFTDASTLTYAGSFAEAAVNDGSVTGSVTATLSGDTFTSAVVSGDHVTATNVPAGLTASFVRTSDTVVTLTLTDSATAHENSDDVSDLTIAFADGAFTNEAAATVSGSTKSDVEIDFRDASGIAYAGSFDEAAANDGSVTGSVTATLTGDTFTSDVVSGNHVTASNVPAGLTASFARTSSTVVTLTLTDSATNHANANDVSNLTVTFTDAAFTDEAASTVGGSTTNDLAVDFRDASSIAYAGGFTEAAANDGSVTGSVTATLTGDTFTTDVVSGDHVSASNVPSGLTASFARTSGTVVTLTLTGNAAAHANSNDVSDLTVTFADGAFTNEVAATIAGATKSDLAIDFTDASTLTWAGGFTEAAANNGSVTGSVTATLTGDTFTSGVVSGNHVSASNVPSGLSASFARTGDTVVTLTLTGRAGAHANSDDVSDLTVAFADGAFTNEAASTVGGSTRGGFAIDFADPDTPTVGSLSLQGGPDSGDTYGAGETITVRVSFAPRVTVDVTGGRPRLALTVGATRRFAEQAGAQNLGSLTLLFFQYTVAADDRDLNGFSVVANSLELNGGAIAGRDGGAAADLSHAGLAAGSGHKVDGGSAPTDTTAPTLQRAEVDGATLTLTFDEALDPDWVPAAGQFTVTVTTAAGSEGAAGAASETRTVTGVAVDGDKVTLTLESPVQDGESVTVKYTPPETNPLGDGAGNGAKAFDGEAVVNNTPNEDGPRIDLITFGSNLLPANGDAFGTGERIGVVIRYDAQVAVTGTPRVPLDIGGATRYAAFSRDDSTLTGVGSRSFLSFVYTVQAGDRDDDGISVAANSLELNGGTIKANTTAGENAWRDHAALAADATRKVDGGPAAEPGLTLDPASTPLAVTEGGTVGYRAVLDARPTGTVVFQVESDNADVTVQPAQLTFETDDWDTEKDLLVTVGEDDDADDETAILTHRVVGISSADEYDDLADVTLEVAVTDNDETPVDRTPPTLRRAEVNGAALALTYDESLDTGSAPAAGAFTVRVADAARTVSAVRVGGRAVTLTLAPAVTAGQTVTVSYDVPDANPIQDAAGNDAGALTNRAVVNSTPRSDGGGGGGGGSPNQPPEADETLAAATLTPGTVLEIGLADAFDDPDNDDLTYAAESSDTSVTTAAVDGATLTVTGVAVGAARITVTAADPDGASASQTFAVTVAGPEAAWYLPPASDPERQGFVRVINHSDADGEATVTATDDAGVGYDPLTLALCARCVRHFNSDDLELGNGAKGLTGATGPGTGGWRLAVESDTLDIEALAYMRTADGFLTAMHSAAPLDADGAPEVATFNPGSNIDQVSHLRLVNPGGEDAEATVTGVDDAGRSPGEAVRLTVPAGSTCTVAAAELESGTGLACGSPQAGLGDGHGKWRLSVESDATLVVMSLLSSPTGHLTNLSAKAEPDADGVWHARVFPAASDPLGRQGFVRVRNRSDEAGTVTVRARDDTDTDYEELTLALDAGETRHFNSDDLELGNERKRLTGSTGAGTGTWRLALSSDDIDIEAHAYIRTTEGFLTAMHAEAPVAESVHRVATFNPGSNPNQVSVLRLVNPGTRGVPVDIAGTDDDGERPGTPVRIVVPAGDAVEVTAAELESGESETISSGALGDGRGKWRLRVESDRDGDPIAVLSLLSSPTGDLTNLSRADGTRGFETAGER